MDTHENIHEFLPRWHRLACDISTVSEMILLMANVTLRDPIFPPCPPSLVFRLVPVNVHARVSVEIMHTSPVGWPLGKCFLGMV